MFLAIDILSAYLSDQYRFSIESGILHTGVFIAYHMKELLST